MKLTLKDFKEKYEIDEKKYYKIFDLFPNIFTGDKEKELLEFLIEHHRVTFNDISPEELSTKFKDLEDKGYEIYNSNYDSHDRKYTLYTHIEMLPSKFLENRLLKDIFHSINQNNYNISCFYQQKVSEVIEKRNLKKLLTVLTLEEINALSEKNQKDSNLQAEASI
jgi:hypothetical protein